MSIAPGELLSVAGASDPETLTEQNLAILTRKIYKLKPTYQNGVANTTVGPPTTGDHVLNELWVDVNLTAWLCTTAGTPGTWKQISVDMLASSPCSILEAQIFS